MWVRAVALFFCLAVVSKAADTPLPQKVSSSGRLESSRASLQRASFNGGERHTLQAPQPRYVIQPAENARLRLGYGITGNWGKDLGAIEVRAIMRTATEESVLFRARHTKQEANHWNEILLPLNHVAERQATLELSAEGVPTAQSNPRLIAWGNPVLEPEPLDPAPSLILISIDTLRANQLGCYGYTRNTSPQIDRLAREGIRFHHTLSSSIWTLPAHASMFTGLHPHDHGAVRFGHKTPLRQQFDSLPELLWDRGYDTGAITGGGFMNLGFQQGFDWFYNSPGKTEIEKTVAMIADALQWLAERRGAPFFLFLHTYLVHAPYEPPPEYRNLFAPPDQPLRDMSTNEFWRWARHGNPDPESLKNAIALYDSEVRYIDEQLGRLFEYVRTTDLATRTCIVVTSDHGDVFNEHGLMFHNHARTFDELLRVPLIVWCPSRYPGGRVVEQPVSLVDVTPTLLDVAGAPLPEGLDGRTLKPFLAGAALPEVTTLSEVDGSVESKVGSVRALRTSRFKLVQSTIDGSHQLYDLKNDPGETRDVAADHPDIVRQLSGQAAPLSAAQPHPTDTDASKKPPPDVEERLRALGYIQ